MPPQFSKPLSSRNISDLLCDSLFGFHELFFKTIEKRRLFRGQCPP